MKVKYIKTLTNENSIEDFAITNGITFSKEFVLFFKTNNGGRPDTNEVSLEKGSEKVVNSFLSFNEEDKENVYKAKKRVEEDDQTLVPFANDPSGNYFCLKNGEVVFYSHEDGETFKVADTFEMFLEKLQ